MDLLEHYVQAVRSFLPTAQQDDIAKELAENLQSQMDDRAAELGRPLTEAEQEAIFRQLGHPLIVAGRYQPNQVGLAFGRQMIGPALFPFYLRVLWFDLGLTLSVFLIALIALIIVGSPISVDGWKNAILLQIFLQFSVVTAIFAIVNYYLPTMSWNAHRPPTLPPAFRQDLLNLSRQRQPVPRLESIAQIVALVVLLSAIRLLFSNQSVIFGTASHTYQLAAVWQRVTFPILGIFGIFIVQAMVNLFRPDWGRFRLIARLVADLIFLGVVVYILQSPQWVLLTHTSSAASVPLSTLNHYVAYGLWILVISLTVALLVTAWQLLRYQPPRSEEA
jgi:hypothetical protein